jgi:hypothetical protein
MKNTSDHVSFLLSAFSSQPSALSCELSVFS